MRRRVIWLALMAAIPLGARGEGIRLESPETRVDLLELYSSEGCSSCPPADRWMADRRREAGLWKRFVPVNFHVDYWDRLGWTDRFSRDTFTARQRRYAGEWGVRTVYTPGFVLNGREWRRGGPYGAPGPKVGRLTVTGEGPYEVRFRPVEGSGAWLAHGALLGNGLETKVTAGENSGETLRHEFVVLSLVEAPLTGDRGEWTGRLSLPSPGEKAESYSVAFWVSRTGSQTPLQAVGADLPRRGGVR